MDCIATEFDDAATFDDVVAGYRIFLRRAPDPAGVEHFGQLVREGITLGDLSNKFTYSAEYRQAHDRLETVDLGGYLVCIDPDEGDFGCVISQHNDYEPHVRRAVAGLFHEGQTFVDIGANVGCISFQAAMIAGPAGRVLSFEPNPTNVKRLYSGIVLNRFTNVRVMPFGASDRRAIFSLTGGTSNTYFVDALPPGHATDYAQSVVLDEELAHLDRIDFVKIDIEGHEPFALRGFSNLIRKHNPTLLTEFNPRCLRVQGFEPDDYLAQLLGLYNHLKVITHYGDSADFSDASGLMALWRRRDEELTAEGELPAGMLHFDVIATNE